MPLTFDVQSNPSLVTVSGSGVGTLEEAVKLIRDIAGAVAELERFQVLVDVRELHYQPELDEARQVATELRTQAAYRRARIAIVCADLAQIGLARFIAAIAGQDGVILESFRDLGPAEDWLNS